MAAMKRTLEFLGGFASFFIAVVGIVLVARGLEIAKGPLTIDPAQTLYHLDLADTMEFYSGCVLVAASLASLWTQRRPK